VLVVQNFECVAIEHGDDSVSYLSSEAWCSDGYYMKDAS